MRFHKFLGICTHDLGIRPHDENQTVPTTHWEPESSGDHGRINKGSWFGSGESMQKLVDEPPVNRKIGLIIGVRKKCGKREG
jgi:hypothetical protein